MATCSLDALRHVQGHLGVWHANNVFSISPFLEAAFENGNNDIVECPLCQNFLAVCYRCGQGISFNIERSNDLVFKAANQGLAKAYGNIGIYFQNGNGLEQDIAKAVFYFKKAIEAGDESYVSCLRDAERILHNKITADKIRQNLKDSKDEE